MKNEAILLSCLAKIHANAAESPEWIRRVIVEARAQVLANNYSKLIHGRAKRAKCHS